MTICISKYQIMILLFLVNVTERYTFKWFKVHKINNFFKILKKYCKKLLVLYSRTKEEKTKR